MHVRADGPDSAIATSGHVNMRAGWRRTDVQPWNPSRVLGDPSVKNCGRCTPELQPTAHADGVYGIPTTVYEFEAKVTPRTRRHVHKLAHGELTAKQLLPSEVRDIRKRRVDIEIDKRSKTLKKIKEERSMALADILEARRDTFPLARWGRALGWLPLELESNISFIANTLGTNVFE